MGGGGSKELVIRREGEGLQKGRASIILPHQKGFSHAEWGWGEGGHNRF